LNMKENWQVINGQFKKCSILKDADSHYSNSSDISTLRDILPFGESDRTIKYDGPIIPMTEAIKKRDREMIKAYMDQCPKDERGIEGGIDRNEKVKYEHQGIPSELEGILSQGNEPIKHS